jgi:hypothetical protein
MKAKILKYAYDIPWIKGISLGKNNVPKWYKDSPIVNNHIIELPAPTTLKHCVPFLDAFLTGYILNTPVDFAVKLIDGLPFITWHDGNEKYIEARDSSAIPTLPTPHGCNPMSFAWATKVALKTPKNYSLLFTHPFNRYDLPFVTLTGITDSDLGLQSGNLPFFIKQGFEGLIPAGTPFAQILPFPREIWKLKKDNSLLALSNTRKAQSNSIKAFYKLNIWKKKEYN